MLQPTIDALKERATEAERLAEVERQRSAELEEQIKASPTELPLSVIDEVPGRRRKLTPEEFEDLKRNLEQNPLVHPVVLRRTRVVAGVQRYELVSGGNRVAIYRLLGRETIAVRVIEADDAQAEDSAFWANLLQSPLPDFEKYLRFRQTQERTGENQTQLAQRAGISKSFVSRLFAFQDLPEQALDILQEDPHLLGAKIAAEMAQLARAGRHDPVVAAMRELATGSISQEEALRLARAGSAARSQRAPRSVQANTIQIRSGRQDFCRMVTRGTSLRLEFKSEEQRAQADQVVERILRELADKASGT